MSPYLKVGNFKWMIGGCGWPIKKCWKFRGNLIGYPVKKPNTNLSIRIIHRGPGQDNNALKTFYNWSSFLSGNRIRQASIPMDISTNNQLVPYSRGPRQVPPFSPREPRLVPSEDSSAAKRYVLMPPPYSPKFASQSGGQETIYTSSRRIKPSETNQVGLLIDIYA